MKNAFQLLPAGGAKGAAPAPGTLRQPARPFLLRRLLACLFPGATFRRESLLFLPLFLPLLVAAPAAAQQLPPNPFKAPLYWSVYEHHITKPDDFENYIPEDEWAANVDWVEKNLKPHGYEMVALDGWGDDSRFNEHGYRTTHSKHWKHDFAWWAKNLQSRGMNLGMYNNPLWVNRAAVNAGVVIKGTNIPLGNIIDPDEKALWFSWVQVNKPGAEEYVKGYVQYYADMGIKYLRVDFLSWFEDGFDKNLGRVGPERPRADYEKALRWMKEACDANGMFLSLVMPHLKNEAELELKYGHMIRINEDAAGGGWFRFSDMARGVRHGWWSQYYNTFDGFAYWSRLSGRNRMILDGDFIRINTMGSDDEKKSVISLHLLAGGPVTPSDQPHTIGNNLWLYQNDEMLALNKDGFVGKPLSNDPTNQNSQVWRGQLSNGDWVVGFFNRESTARTRSIDFAGLGFKGGAHVRDLWAHNELGEMKSYSVSVPPRGCVVVKISKTTPTQVTGPVFSRPGAIYTAAQSITLTTPTTAAIIHYTLDGSEPTTASRVYTGPIAVAGGTVTLRAFARKEPLAPSPVFSQTYTVNRPGPLPAPWQSAGVGALNPAGSTSFADGAFVITAAGADIEGTADAFGFIHRPLSGDATLTARVTSLTNTHEWTKAGIMFRESLDANARNAFVGITPANRAIFQRRADTGGRTSGNVTAGVAAPAWLRIQRVGNEISAFRSADGVTWTPVGSAVNVSLGATVLAGPAFTSHADGTLGAATFTDVVVGDAANAAATPVFSPAPGTYTGEQSMSLTSATPGAVIRYTTDGSVPNGSSPVYGGPLAVAATTTLRAFASAAGKVNSPVVSATYTITAPGPEIVSGGIYKITARHSGKVLDVVGGSQDNGARIHQWSSFNGPSQQWLVTDAGSGFYRIENRNSGKVLDVEGGSRNDGAPIHQWQNFNLASQQWAIVKVSEAHYRIENRNSGKSLDVFGASADNGAAVNQFAYTGGLHQQWSLELVEPPRPVSFMYIGGTFNNWSLSTAMTLTNGVWKATGVAISAGNHQLKFANTNNWSGDDWGDASGLSGTARLTTGGAPNISFVIAAASTFTLTFNPQTLAYAIVDEAAPAARTGQPAGLAQELPVRLYPNPARSEVVISYTAAAAGEVSITLRNALGTPVFRTTRPVTAGENVIPFGLPASLKSGLHTVSIAGGTGQQHARLLIGK